MSREMEELARIARGERARTWTHVRALPLRVRDAAAAYTRKHPFLVTAGVSALAALLVRGNGPRAGRDERSEPRLDGERVRGGSSAGDGLLATALAMGMRGLPSVLQLFGGPGSNGRGPRGGGDAPRDEPRRRSNEGDADTPRSKEHVAPPSASGDAARTNADSTSGAAAPSDSPLPAREPARDASTRATREPPRDSV